MKQIFSLIFFFVVANVCYAQEYVPSGGPVYVNPAQQIVLTQAQSVNEGTDPLLTQTVYGFLDFTTTIGNTVMIFSPQSAPPAGEKKEEVKTIIETKPPTTTPPTEIKPSKISEKKGSEGVIKKPVNEIKASPPVLSSIVEVREGPETSAEKLQEVTLPIKEKRSHTVNQILSSKVEVREGPSVVQEDPFGTVGGPVLFSKVEVREGPSQIVNIEKEEETHAPPPSILSSIVEVIGGETSKVLDPPTILSSVVQVIGGDINSPKVTPTQQVSQSIPEPPVIFSSHVEIIESAEEPAIQGNNIIDPEYDFLSRQPSEIVDETYRVINLRPSSKFHLKHKPSGKAEDQPTGLVSKMGGTVIKDGVTTVHETKVIGTFISGKYTQVQQTSSKIKASPTARILRTAGPTGFGKGRLPYLEPTPAGSNREETIALPLEALFSSAANSNQIRTTKRLGGVPRNRFNLRNKLHENREQDLENNEDEDYAEPPQKKTSKPNRPTQSARAGFRSTKGYSKFGRASTITPTTAELATVSVFPEASTAVPRLKQQRRPGGGYRSQSASASTTDAGHSRRFKPKASPVELDRSTSTSLYKFKLARPQGRWQYKTTPKPRVTIRKSDDGLDNITTTSPSPQYEPEQRAELRERSEDVSDFGDEVEAAFVQEVRENIAESQPSTVAAETIKVEISTPADFKDVYYELATIRSPYTFQVGTVKNTRYITVTSTYEKSLVEPTIDTTSEPLTENILATTLAPHYTQSLPLDSSIATLPPIALASDVETPPLETLTETFSTTQLLLKTHILPVVHQGDPDTTSYTLVQSYHVTRFVTAIKTLPPMDAYSFHPSRTLTDLNTRLEEAGSELHLELEFGDENDSDEPAALRALRPDIDLASVGSDLDIADLDKVNIPEGHLRHKKAPEPLPKIASNPNPKYEQTTPQYTAEQLQQLALLRFLNPAAAASLPQVVTSSRPVFKLETVYESHVLPLFDGVSTHYSTLSRPVGTITKTEYEYVTSTVTPPLPNINALFPQQQFPQQQFPQQQFPPQQFPQQQGQQFAVTSSPVVQQTMVTATESKILKLTFGAKTAYTTIFSTKVVPTILTTYLTQSVPVAGAAGGYNPYFPAPYQPLPQFSFVG